jgi:hypothetical protein
MMTRKKYDMNASKAMAKTDRSLAVSGAPQTPEDSTSLTEILGRFLRLYVAEGDASPATIRTYHAQAAQYVAWCQQQGISPSTAT